MHLERDMEISNGIGFITGERERRTEKEVEKSERERYRGKLKKGNHDVTKSPPNQQWKSNFVMDELHGQA